MDRVFSTRLDEDVVRRVDRFVRERSISKKGLVEQALRAFLDRIDPNHEHDVVERSFGAWKRKEPAEKTWLRSREAFNRSFRRHSTHR
jgi:hypothetical protein